MSTLEVDKIIPQSGTATQLGESGDTITIPAGATITNNGTANGFGSADTEKVKVSSNDTTAGFLNGKLVAGTNISLTEGSDGGNETLTAALSGTITPSDNTVTLAKMAPGTDGNIISYDASGDPVAVATGSAGQVLTSAGAGAPPTFAAASGDFVKISTTTVSSATSSASLTGINSTYMNYVIKANDIAQASTGTNLRFRYINSSGDITSSSYYGIGDGAYKPYNSADAILRFSLYNTNYGQVTNFNGSSNTGYTSSFEMNLPNPSNANTMPSCYGQNLTDGENGTYLTTNIFSFKQTAANTAVTGIKFYFDGVNITQGNFTLYGIKG